MSSHHSQKSINLHHLQVSAGKERRKEKQAERLQRYLLQRQDAVMRYNFIMCMTFLWFAYSQLATSLYLGYIL